MNCRGPARGGTVSNSRVSLGYSSSTGSMPNDLTDCTKDKAGTAFTQSRSPSSGSDTGRSDTSLSVDTAGVGVKKMIADISGKVTVRS